MAEFNPRTNMPGAPDYTGESKGFTSGLGAVGTAVKGFGEITAGVIDTVDKNNVRKIEEAAQKGVDSALEPWGVLQDNPATPQELITFGDRIALVRKAYLNGNLRESNFQFQIDAEAKKIRAKYPGYRDVIDSTISKVLGQSTANDLRKTLQQEWQSQQAESSDIEKERRARKNQYIKDGAMPPDYLERELSGNPYPWHEIEIYAASKYAEDQDNDRRRKKLDFDVAQGNADQTKITEHFRYETTSFVTRAIGDSLGMITDDLFKQKADLDKSGDVSVEELDAAFGPIQADLKNKWLAQMMSSEHWTKLDSAKRADVEQILTSKIDIFKDLIYDDKSGLLGLAKRQLDIKERNADLALLNHPKYGKSIEILGAIQRKTGSSEVFNSALMNNSETMKLVQGVGSLLVTNIADPDNPDSPEKTTRSVQEISGGKLTENDILATIKIGASAITSDEATPETDEFWINKWFGPENKEYIWALQQPMRAKAFNHLVNPRVRDKILATGNPQLIGDFRDWMYASFGALFEKEAQTLMDVHRYSDFVTFDYNPEQMRFSANVDPRYNKKTLLGGRAYNPAKILEQWKKGESFKSMNRLNGYLSNLKPVLDATGEDSNETIEGLFRGMGVDFTQKKSGSFLAKLGEVLSTNIHIDVEESPLDIEDQGGLDDEVRDSIKKGQSVTPFKEGDKNASVRDFISKAEGADYNTLYGGRKIDLSSLSVGEVASLGDRQVKKGSPSSAVGRYQFLSKTLKRAVAAGWVSEDEAFTPELQDKLADFLIEERRKVAGDDKEKLAHELSQEWAGLPSGPEGRSFYEGVAGNKATVGWAELMGAL